MLTGVKPTLLLHIQFLKVSSNLLYVHVVFDVSLSA